MVFIFEGMDNCLKDTLIQQLREHLSAKTQILKFSSPPKNIEHAESYQKKHFSDMFDLLSQSLKESERNLILNRAHLGEYVYSPIYRGYNADWIFDLEKKYLKHNDHSRLTTLILLYDSNNEQLILREDGHSLSKNQEEKLNIEREKFKEAFDKSLIFNKMKFDLKDYYTTKSENKRKVDTKAILEHILTSTK